MRRSGRIVAAAGLAAVAAVGCAQPGQLGSAEQAPEPAVSAPPAPPEPDPALPALLGRGLVDYPVLIDTPGPAVYSVRTEVLPAGGTTGWHLHPGTETSIVTAGEVTMLAAEGCEPVGYGTGDALFVPDGVPHEARNDGTVTAELVVTYLLAPGAPDRVDAPPACPE